MRSETRLLSIGTLTIGAGFFLVVVAAAADLRVAAAIAAILGFVATAFRPTTADDAKGLKYASVITLLGLLLITFFYRSISSNTNHGWRVGQRP